MSDSAPTLLNFVKKYPPRKTSEFGKTLEGEIHLSTPNGLYSFYLILDRRYPEERVSSPSGYLSQLIQHFHDYVANFTDLALGSGRTFRANTDYLWSIWDCFRRVFRACGDHEWTGEALMFVGLLALKDRLEEKRLIRVEEVGYTYALAGKEKTIKVVDVSSGILGASSAEPTSTGQRSGRGYETMYSSPEGAANSIQCERLGMYWLKYNLDLSSNPKPFQLASRESVVRYYSQYPTAAPPMVDPSRALSMVAPLGPDKQTCSSKPREVLELISLERLACPKRHEGQYVICRILSDPVVGVGFSIAVEDSKGQAMALTIENYWPAPAIVTPYERIKELFPIGMVLAIREPYVHHGFWTGLPEIRVLVPTDIEILKGDGGQMWRCSSPSDLPVYTVDELKARGNSAVQRQDHELAIRFYTAAITDPDVAPSEKAILLLNRALSHISTKKYSPALIDCLAIDRLRALFAPDNTLLVVLTPAQQIKLSHRKLQAAYKLRLWSKAERYLRECEADGLDRNTLKPFQDGIKLRLAEEKGNWNWMLHALRLVDTEFADDVDISDYRGPIAIKHRKSTGRYVVVTEDVVAGTILLVEKAALNCEGTRGLIVRNPIVHDQCSEARMSTNQSPLGVHQFISDPSKTFLVEGLYPGNKRFTPHANESKRWEMITKGLEGVGGVEVDELNVKTTMNSFNKADEAGITRMDMYGIGSLINHSCLPNVYNGGWADVHITRARNDLKAGDELTFSYVDSERNYASRQLSFNGTWRFKCTCPLCIADSAPGDDHLLRARLIAEQWPALSRINELKGQANQVSNALQNSSGRIAGEGIDRLTVIKKHEDEERLHQFIRDVDATYAKGRTAPKLELAMLLTKKKWTLGRMHGLSPSEAYIRLFELQGGVLSTPEQLERTGRAVAKLPPSGEYEETCRLMLSISILIRAMESSNPVLGANLPRSVTDEQGDQWTKSAWWAYKILMGEMAVFRVFQNEFSDLLTCQPGAKFA